MADSDLAERYRILTAGERPAERMLRVTLLTAVLAWAVLGGWWPWLLLLWFVPLVTTQVWIGAVAELMEPRLGGALGGLEQIYRKLPPSPGRDRAGTALNSA